MEGGDQAVLASASTVFRWRGKNGGVMEGGGGGGGFVLDHVGEGETS